MKPLRVLIVEDHERDAALLVRELRKGYELTHVRVWTLSRLVEELEENRWEIVISDWDLGNFTGLDAYRAVREKAPDIPFLIISGTIAEDNAVEALKAGVHDFLLKGRYARLLPAIERELREAELRRHNRAVESEMERRAVEIAESEQLLRKVLESVPDGVVVTDRDGVVFLSNRAAAQLIDSLPLKTGRAEGRPDPGWFLPDRATPCPPEELPLAYALREERPRTTELYHRSGSHEEGSCWQIKEVPLLGWTGSVRGALAVFRDITNEKATQEKLLIADRMVSIGMLAAGVGHEINNPLAAVTANLDLVREELESGGAQPDLEEISDMLNEARSAAERVAQIVRDLKLLSRHEDSFSDAVDLTRPLTATLRMAQSEIKPRARLVQRFEKLPPIVGSDSRLGQVFLNLVVNAAQSIPAGAPEENTIRVEARRHGERYVSVTISDTGCGIAPEHLQRLFTPFFTTKPAGIGTGLGLALCQRIVDSLGGEIHITSTLGTGTTVCVLLPIAGTAPPPARTPRRAAETGGRS